MERKVRGLKRVSSGTSNLFLVMHIFSDDRYKRSCRVLRTLHPTDKYKSLIVIQIQTEQILKICPYNLLPKKKKNKRLLV